MDNIIKKDFDSTIKYINGYIHIDESFDLVCRTVCIGGRKACIYFTDGFVKDDIMQKIQDFTYDIAKEDMPDNAHEFLQSKLPYVEIDCTNDIKNFAAAILSGMTGLIISGYKEAVLIDCRTYPARGVGEPEKDKTLRGSRDGFVETIVMNVALIRRRIRSAEFHVNIFTAGKSSKTDIAVCYMNDRADKKLLKKITDKISNINVDALTMNQESLAECIQKQNWYNPFPKFKYSERPDVSASAILEGHIVILVDNSPAAMILPTDIFDLAEDADDYYFPPITGTYLRFARTVISIAALIITPLYLLFAENPGMIPSGFEFIKPDDPVNIPILAQLLILEIAIDGLKLAAVNTPAMLSTPLSIIAGVVIGDFAVSGGWFNPETMLYMSFVAFANFTHGSFELGYAVKFFRMLILLLTAIFNIYGFFAGIIICIAALCLNKTVAGRSYVYPLIPFDYRELKRKLIRRKKIN